MKFELKTVKEHDCKLNKFAVHMTDKNNEMMSQVIVDGNNMKQHSEVIHQDLVKVLT